MQTKMYELEGQVRRGAAERGVEEMKKNEFQGEIQRQKEQINHIENFYKRQLEEAQEGCTQEKVHTVSTGIQCPGFKMTVKHRWVLIDAVFLLLGCIGAEHLLQYQNYTGTKRFYTSFS